MRLLAPSDRARTPIFLLLFAPHAAAGWIGVCDDAGGRKVLESLVNPQGKTSVLVASATRLPAECLTRELPVEPNSIVWARLLTPQQGAALKDGVMIDGEELVPLRELPAKAPPYASQPPAPPAVRPSPKRALWAWSPEFWSERPQELFAVLAATGADTAFITVTLDAAGKAVAEPGRLARFVESASERGVKVWAVAGDPRAVLPSERPKYAARARALADYNRNAPPAAKLAGLQLDIEPYLNRGYDIDAQGWVAAYVDTIAEAKRAVQMPLDVALPFWWGTQKFRGRPLIEHLAPHVDVVTVMNYRTDRNLILEFADPYLSWSQGARRAVRIALEAGKLPDPPVRVYRPDARGELWIIPLRTRALALLLEQPAAGLPGSAFRYSHDNPPSARRITFHGELAKLRELLPALEDTWRAWPDFAGIALHGLD